MSSPNAITAIQDAYVEKVIDTLNDLPNVLWIVSEEAPEDSNWWNDHQIAHIRSYESGKPYQHPIGYATQVDLGDTTVMNSDADWIAGGSRIAPTTSCGSGTPPCKVNVNDSDHSYFGMWNGTAQNNRNFAWENFTNGNQVAFMDPYVLYYPREGRNPCPSPTNGICGSPDPRWTNFRANLGYILTYSRKLNLANVTPRGSLCSTGACLAQTPSVGAEYLIYAPNGGSFTVNLSAMSSARTLNVEWFNPATGATTTGTPIPAGSSSRSFTPPFSGDAVLYLVDSAGHAGTAVSPQTSYSVTGLGAGTYRYRVLATDAAGNPSPYSNIAGATIQASDTEPPTAPGGLTATTPASGQIALNWTAATDNVAVTGYLVERCQGAGCSSFVQVAAPAGTGTTFTDSGLPASTSFSYRVRAVDTAANPGPYSNTATATTQPAARRYQPDSAYEQGRRHRHVVVAGVRLEQRRGQLDRGRDPRLEGRADADRHGYSRQHLPQRDPLQRNRRRHDARHLLRGEYCRRPEHRHGVRYSVGWHVAVRHSRVFGCGDVGLARRDGGGARDQRRAEQRIGDDSLEWRPGDRPRFDGQRPDLHSGHGVRHPGQRAGGAEYEGDRRRPATTSGRPGVSRSVPEQFRHLGGGHGCVPPRVGWSASSGESRPDPDEDPRGHIHSRAERCDLHVDGVQQPGPDRRPARSR